MLKIILLLTLNMMVHMAWADAANQPLKIDFAMEATYPPFEYMNEDGQIIGVDVDIANAICEQIKASCTFSNQPFASLIPSLKIGKYDAIISAVSITPDREKQVDFTIPYYQQSASFVAPKNVDVTLSADGLKGKSIGTQMGTSLENYLRKEYGDEITIKTYSSIVEAFLDLTAGRLDLVFADTPVAQSWLQQKASQDYRLVDGPVYNSIYFGKGFGIAVKKGNAALLAQLDTGIESIKQNGLYQEIMKKYFPTQK